ncbi:MAG: glycosyltransferase [Lachnospiraceae bacterium]|nr:glycosyltransferase [Lachnospiraceae bacterium]
MNILHITAQKPCSTGSGVYLTKLAESLSSLQGVDRQGILAGVYADDISSLKKVLSPVTLYPVVFDSPDLPFHIFGMSDVMPYPSSQYKSMTPEQYDAFTDAFLFFADKAVEDLNPDVIICHHLYLLTALIRQNFPEIPVYGFCHNTDLTQFKAHDLARDLILEQIPNLNGIFALHGEQKKVIAATFSIPEDIIHIAGAGYDDDVFYKDQSVQADHTADPVFRMIFTGKLSRAKGVPCLLRALKAVFTQKPDLEIALTLAGGTGSPEEYNEIKSLADACPYPVTFTGPVYGQELANLYRVHDCFILPSLNEGLPLCVIEALACGLPVIMTDLPGIRPWIESHIKDAPVSYVPVSQDHEQLTRHLADTIIRQTQNTRPVPEVDLSSLTWKALAGHIFQIL